MRVLRKVAGLILMSAVAFVAGVIASSCTSASRGYGESPRAEIAAKDNRITIQDDNWWATAVDFYCDGRRVKTAHNLNLGQKERLSLPLWRCMKVQFVVRGRGNRTYTSEPFVITQGTGLWITVGATMNLTSYFQRQEA